MSRVNPIDNKKRFPMLNPSRHQVLIVEDDAAVRNTLALLLKASGYEVSTAANGAEALALLQMGTPAILLSDLNMPEMSGFELLAVARRQFPELSLIAMSGEYETSEAIPTGAVADAFYAKGRGNLKGLLRILSEMTSAPAAEPRRANPLIN
jgi:CheY-like chemotaxis protein